MTGSLREQLVKSGLTTKEIQQFDIFSVADDSIIFPEERLGQKRWEHKRRLVIVLQNDKDNQYPTIRIILIAPSLLGNNIIDFLIPNITMGGTIKCMLVNYGRCLELIGCPGATDLLDEPAATFSCQHGITPYVPGNFSNANSY